jgi:hypothetical protein
MKKNWWRSLQVKIIAWSFIPTLIILSAVAWFTFYSYQKVLGDLAMKQDWAVVHAKADQAHEAFAGLINSHLRPIIFDIDTDPGLAASHARHLTAVGRQKTNSLFSEN